MKKENGSWHNKPCISFIALVIFIAMAVTSINACGYLGIFGEASWKEEVLLHDGSKIIVKRWQKRVNVYSFEPSSLTKEQSISFKLPGTNKKIVWEDVPAKDIQTANFALVALHIKNNIPYLIMEPYGCMAYNKWGRPNPPYVIFKYEGNDWKRIALAELPLEFTTVNLVLNTTSHKHKKEIGFAHSSITAEKVKELNKSLSVHEIYKTIVRTPHEGGGRSGCEELIYNGRGWTGLYYFKKQSSYEDCFNECKKIMHDIKYCPCSRLFKNNKKGE